MSPEIVCSYIRAAAAKPEIADSLVDLVHVRGLNDEEVSARIRALIDPAAPAPASDPAPEAEIAAVEVEPEPEAPVSESEAPAEASDDGNQ